MPHEPLTGDALLDALSEVPGDPAEPVPARTVLADLRLTVPSDIAEQSMRDLLKRNVKTASATPQPNDIALFDHMPSPIVPSPYTIDPGHAFDDVTRRQLEDARACLLRESRRVSDFNPHHALIPHDEIYSPEWRDVLRELSVRVRHKQPDPPPESGALSINPTEEENPE